MFKKMPSGLAALQIRDDMDKMNINHEFFLLVREQKYEEAYAIGVTYLKYHPENLAIKKFCQFIEGNREDLIEMVKDEEEYTDESEEEEDSESQDDDKSVFSDVSRSSLQSVASVKSLKSVASSVKSSSSSISKKGSVLGSNKENGKINPANKWQHRCKNEKCPNKKSK